MTSPSNSPAARRSERPGPSESAAPQSAPGAASSPSATEITAAPAVAEASIEDVIAARAGALLARIGDTVPDLHAAVLEQAERGLFRAVLAHTGNHLGRASLILGLDRNTCARKARNFGLVDRPSRGPTPKPKKPRRASKPKPRAVKKKR